MKKNKPFGELFYRSLKKTLLTMRIAVILMILGILQARANDAYSQKTRLSINFSETELVKVLDKIETESEFFFMYNEKLLDTERKVSIDAKDQLISVILDNLFTGTDVKYTIIDRKIILAPDFLTEVPQPQKFKVSGTITDSKGEAIPGVNVILKGTVIGVITDIAGKYTINVPDGNGTLVFSFIGYTNQEIAINGSSTIDAKLQEESKTLGEVVVTALGISREAKTLSYSAQGLNTEEIKQAHEPNVMMALQGKVAGLSINSSGSGLGADARVVLRGNRSISGDSQPLYVIDGVITRGNPATLSMDNIASMSILKGPNAAALYGSAAQNGVIIIETKKGQESGVNVSLNSSFMVQDAVLSIPFQNVYGQGSNGLYQKTNEFTWGPKMEGQMVDNWSLDPTQAGTQYAFTPQPNAKEKAYNRGYNSTTNLFVSAGNEKTQTALSYTLTNAKGTLPGNELQRQNVSLRVNNKLSKRLSMDAKIDYMHQQIKNQLAEGESNFNPDRQIYTMPSNIHLADARHFEFKDLTLGRIHQNYWNPTTTTGANPFWTLHNDPNKNTLERIIAMTSLTYSFSDALTFMVRGSYDGGNGTAEERLHNDTFVRAPDGRLTLTKSASNLLNGDFLLSYKKNLSKDINVSANVGGSVLQSRNTSLSANTGVSMIVPNFFTLSNTSLPVTSNDPGSNSDVQSLYAFGNIGWKNALFFDITGRNDWSSTLPARSRSYFYPSFGLSALLKELIPSLPSTISFAKLRASWAEVGNSASPYMLDRAATFRAGGNNGFLQFSSILPNPNLKPEMTKSTEIGLDIRFFESRLGLDVTLYKTNTFNQLFTISLPVGSGAAQYYTNGGNVQNKGIELLLTGTPVQTHTLQWDVNVNFSLNRNLVVKISDERPRIVVGDDPYVHEFVVEQGKPYGQLYSKGWMRDDQGRVIIGTNGMPKITSGRTVQVANFNADWQGGMTNTITFKRFDFSFLIEHRQGGSIVSMTNAILDGAGLTERTLEGRDGGLIFGQNLFSNEAAVLEDGSPNTIPITAETFWLGVGGRNTPVGEAFVSSATNTRLREMSFGYSLPEKTLGNLHVSNVKISLVGRNLLYIYRASPDLDTDLMVGTSTSSEGFQSFAPPTTRSWGLNIKVDF